MKSTLLFRCFENSPALNSFLPDLVQFYCLQDNFKSALEWALNKTKASNKGQARSLVPDSAAILVYELNMEDLAPFDTGNCSFGVDKLDEWKQVVRYYR